MKAIELATFKLKTGVDEAALQTAVAETDKWLARQPGFILRRHGRNGDGDCVDYVEWESMEHAMKAAETFCDAPEARNFMAALDAESTICRHYDLIS
jgi:hypothetical protein